MRGIYSWLVAIFMVAFWVFRIVLAFTHNIGVDIGIPLQNETAEIIILFATIPFILLVLKRTLIGGLGYFLLYTGYFGYDIYQNITTSMDYVSIAVSLLGIILAMFAFADILVMKGRAKTGGKDRTDWYYKNKDYDRVLDERVDKNHYKF